MICFIYPVANFNGIAAIFSNLVADMGIIVTICHNVGFDGIFFLLSLRKTVINLNNQHYETKISLFMVADDNRCRIL